MPVIEKQEVMNTIPSASEGEGYEYEEVLKPEETDSFICGLIAIKNVVRNTEWGEKEAYRLVFRVAKTPEYRGYITTTVNASAKNNSNMFKLLRNMSGKKIKEKAGSDYADENELFQFMLNSLDKWFMVEAIGVEYKGVAMTFVDGVDVKPTKEGPKEPPSVFFRDNIKTPDKADTPSWT